MPFLQDISIKKIWLVGIVIHVLAAWLSKGYFHVDEHFQLLEYASYKLHRTDISNLPWEYGKGMRPSLQVMVAYLMTFCLQFLNPFHIAFILRLLSVALALTAVYHAGKTVFHNEKHLKLYYLIALSLWFMPYQYVRFSSENWSGFMMLFSVILVLRNKPMIYCGLLSGLAFCFRYQAAFFIFGLFMWLLFIKKANIRQVSFFISGFLIVFMLGVLTDYWLYGKWVLSSYQYFFINLVEGKAAEYGTEPFYYYFKMITESAMVPIGLLLIMSYIFFLTKQPKSVFTWVSLPFLLLHCLIAHKELRFLFPLVYFVPVFLTVLLSRLDLGKTKQPAIIRIFAWLCIVLNFILLPLSSFKASNPRISLQEHLYKTDEAPVCLKENPYLDVHWYTFYFPEKFDPRHLQVVSTGDSLRSGQTLIVRSYISRLEATNIVYRQVPPWLEQVNYGHWLDRSNFWCIVKKQ